MKGLIRFFLGLMSYRIVKSKPTLSGKYKILSSYCSIDLKSPPIIDLQAVENIGWSIQGMISPVR